MKKDIHYILTDIEGTTTSISFVYEVLFPYFRVNFQKLKALKFNPEVFEAFEQAIEIAKEEGKSLHTTEEILEQILQWSLEDKKITPLKTLQGILWEEAYISGEIKGHVYPDVLPAFEKWKSQGKQIGIFSSGSVAAQKLIFGYSESGDLNTFLSHYFDTKTGGKREGDTYLKISKTINVKPENILFLSDIKEELGAAKIAGLQTIQLVREGNSCQWENCVSDFSEITF